MTADRARLTRLLGSLDLASLRRRLRARFEQDRTTDEFTLNGLNERERRALEGLLGRSLRSADSMRLRRSELDTALARAGLADNLQAALSLLDGPIVNLRAQRTARALAWARTLAQVGDARVQALVADPKGAGLLKRLSKGRTDTASHLLESAARVLARLPAAGVPRSRLAAEVLGNAHSLDVGSPVATLLLRAWDHGAARIVGERLRDRWARLGVTVNELARPVLLLNVHAVDHSYGAQKANSSAERGEPTHLTLRDLLRAPPSWEVSSKSVFICENPEVIAAAADALAHHCAPMVCTEGMPAAAQRVLLTQLVARGARLHYHGDFDWGGIRIGNFVMRAFGAIPWRFGAREYLEIVRSVKAPLSGFRVEASWDANLATAMITHGVLIHEEAVIDTMMQDLRRGHDPTPPGVHSPCD
jgi:uncharacterized protein (TIGR02679 family)